MKITIYNQQKDLSAILWDLKRFGLTPSKLGHRLTASAGSDTPLRPIVLSSLPKSGTHLIETVLAMHPKVYRPLIPTIEDRNVTKFKGIDAIVKGLRPGQFLVTHLSYSEEREKIFDDASVGLVFMKRDPRAVLYSLIRFVEKRTDHYMHDAQIKLTSLQDKIQLHLDGLPAQRAVPFAEQLRTFLEWDNRPGVVTLRFEDLVGKSGGGDAAVQTDSFRKVFELMGLQVEDEWLEELPSRMPTKATPTYRSGKIGEWQTAFDEKALTLIDDSVGEYIAAAGYERWPDKN